MSSYSPYAIKVQVWLSSCQCLLWGSELRSPSVRSKPGLPNAFMFINIVSSIIEGIGDP